MSAKLLFAAAETRKRQKEQRESIRNWIGAAACPRIRRQSLNLFSFRRAFYKAHELCSCRPRAFAETAGCALFCGMRSSSGVNVKALGIIRGLSVQRSLLRRGAADRGRTGTRLPSRDFKSRASANSATAAKNICDNEHYRLVRQGLSTAKTSVSARRRYRRYRARSLSFLERIQRGRRGFWAKAECRLRFFGRF